MFYFIHGLSPKGLTIGLMQNMLLVSGTQLFTQEVGKVIINNDVIKHIGNFDLIIEDSSSTIVDWDGKLISQVDLLAAPVRVPKRLTNLWSGGDSQDYQ